jgi:molybdopterin molybdotransferase
MTHKAKRDPEEEVPLLPVDDHLARVLEGIEPLTPVAVPIIDASGLVTTQDVRAPRDLPPFASSAMDGYALRSSDIASATDGSPVALRLIEEVRIGRSTSVSVGDGEASPISTGAIVPVGADAVIPVELTSRSGEEVLIHRALTPGKHVRPAGEDVHSGDGLVGAGRRLRAPDIAVLAASGFAEVVVRPPARVAVVSTGDELVRPGRELAEGQIYDSNTYALLAAITEAGAIGIDGACATDEPDSLVAALDAVYDDVDAFVCSGGVSMGERDPVKRAFEADSEITFANVAMQPGRPQAFGRYRGKPFFGLPGNPVSVFVSFEVFVRPALMKMMGRTDSRPTIDAILEGKLEAPRTRARYARVRVRRDDGGFVAIPEGGHQSNLIVTFSRADGLIRVPPGADLANGDRCEVSLLRDV